MKTDRQKLEELIFLCLTESKDPPISFSYGAELLGFTIIEMREWLNSHDHKNNCIDPWPPVFQEYDIDGYLNS